MRGVINHGCQEGQQRAAAEAGRAACRRGGGGATPPQMPFSSPSRGSHSSSVRVGLKSMLLGMSKRMPSSALHTAREQRH